MLIYCAQNLNLRYYINYFKLTIFVNTNLILILILSVKATCSAAKTASFKLKADSPLKFRWIRKKEKITQNNKPI